MSSNKKRILYIAPHLSTGGMPQYLLKKIEIFSNIAEIYCVLWKDNAQLYDVQKKQIAKILGENFIILGENKHDLVDIIIPKISPDIIHFEDISERFIPFHINEKIYNTTRTYFICETPHSSNTMPEEKIFLPDKFIMVNQWMVDFYSRLDTEFDILEYYLPPVEKYNKKDFINKLELSENKKHIINVGLFTPGKNQGELIEYAKILIDEPIEFHFLGNMAPNFAHYWEPLIKDLPINCKLWGEVDNVSDFYKAADLFLFTSKFELAPIVIKESISHRLPIFLNKLPSYNNDYDCEYVEYLEDDIHINIDMIKRKLEL